MLLPIAHIAVAQPGETASFTLPYQEAVKQVVPSPDLATEQSWFFSSEWQSGEEEASAEIAAGNLTYYDNEDEFLESF